jgi:hypothetical protein
MCEAHASAQSSSGAGRLRWGLLYGMVLPPLAALALIELAGPPGPVRTVLDPMLALGPFLGMALWIRASRTALDLQNWCACAGSSVTVRVIESRRPETPVERLEPSPPEEAHELLAR